MENKTITIAEQEYKNLKKVWFMFEELNDELCKLTATADGFDCAVEQCKNCGLSLTDFILTGYSMCFGEHINKTRDIVGEIEGLMRDMNIVCI